MHTENKVLTVIYKNTSLVPPGVHNWEDVVILSIYFTFKVLLASPRGPFGSVFHTKEGVGKVLT